MHKLVIEPTPTAQWQALVSEAEVAAHCQLDETLESYLVFTLMRFVNNAELVASLLGMEFLHSVQTPGTLCQERLRDVGDKCLLFSGLFPQQAQRRLVTVGYFVRLGRSAYSQLKMQCTESVAGMYGQLADDFVSMMDVLQAMSGLGSAYPPDLLAAFELWQETGSQRARQQLRDHGVEERMLSANLLGSVSQKSNLH